MTLIMLRCKRCGEPIDLATPGAHRARRRRNRATWYVHTDTGRMWCGLPRALIGRPAAPDVDRLARDTVAALDKRYTLRWVDHYDDRLTPKQIQVLLDGGNECESDEFSRLEDIESDMCADASVQVVRELLDPELFDLLDDTEHLDEIRWDIRDRDDSDSLADLLLKNSPSSLFRYDLGVDVPDYTIGEHGWTEAVEEIARAAGLDRTDSDAETLIAELMSEASYGGRLYVLWYTDPVDALALAAPHDPDDARGVVTFTGASLLVLDSWNGSGHEVAVPVVTAEWEPRRVSIDAANVGGGWSWTDTAGPVASAYAGSYQLDRVNRPEAEPTTTTAGGNPDVE